MKVRMTASLDTHDGVAKHVTHDFHNMMPESVNCYILHEHSYDLLQNEQVNIVNKNIGGHLKSVNPS